MDNDTLFYGFRLGATPCRTAELHKTNGFTATPSNGNYWLHLRAITPILHTKGYF